jgi:4-carboxymuconolactone decarboxylase
MSGSSTPRILPLAPDQLGPEAMALATRQRANYGLATSELPETVATLLRHPELYKAYIDFVNRRGEVTVLDRRELEIVILRTAWLCRCGYVWGEHVKFGKQAGLSATEIEGLIEGSAAAGWNGPDRALVRLVEDLHDSADVGDEVWATLAGHFTDQQLIELLMVVGSYHQIAFLYNAIRVRLMPGNPGLAAR